MLLTEGEEIHVCKILDIRKDRLIRPRPFNFIPLRWKKWRESFLDYLDVLQCKNGCNWLLRDLDQVFILMYLLGTYGKVQAEETFSILERNGWEPRMGIQYTLNSLTEHFQLCASILYVRTNFHLRAQLPGESISDYVKAIKFLVEFCKFDRKDAMLRDKLVVGILDIEARERMFELDDMLTFEVAENIAYNHELRTARRHGLN